MVPQVVVAWTPRLCARLLANAEARAALHDHTHPFGLCLSALGTVLAVADGCGGGGGSSGGQVTGQLPARVPARVYMALRPAGDREDKRGRCLWRLTEDGFLENKATGLVLEAEGCHRGRKVSVVANLRTPVIGVIGGVDGSGGGPWQRQPSQQWRLTGENELVNGLGCLLTVRNGSAWKFAEAWLNTRNGTSAQKWFL